MHRIVNISIGFKSAAAVLIAASLLAGSVLAAEEAHSHPAEAPHSDAAGGAGQHADAEHGKPGTHDAADAHGGEHGKPPLSEDLPFWGIVAFIGFIFAVKKLGWASLTSNMASREAEERKLISDAEEVRRQAAELLTSHRGQMEAIDEHVNAALDEADRDADHTRSDIRGTAEREAANARARVDLEISRVKDQTLNDLFENFTQRVIESTQDQLRGRLDPAAQDKLINAALEEFAAARK
jgi:F0F1-type ATP synthase membrane subunit b/b'